jgi:hypothetical protein
MIETAVIEKTSRPARPRLTGLRGNEKKGKTNEIVDC